MQEAIAKVLLALRGAWRYRWRGVLATWIVAIVGWAGVQFIPDQYVSSTQVYIDAESLLRPLLSGLAVDRDVMSDVGLMQTVMLGRPNLEKVAQEVDLMVGANTPTEQEAVIDSLARRIQLDKSGGRSIFVVSFRDRDAKVAHLVVRTLLDTFMENSLGVKRADAGVAERFLESQIKEYEQKLVEAEQGLAAFKQQNVGVMPGSAGGYFQRLETEMNTLQQLRQVYSQLQNRRDELARQLQGEEPSFGLLGAAEATPIDGQIARFQAQRDQLLLQYTERHPQVQSLTQTIAQLEQEKREGKTISNSVAPPGAEAGNEQAMVRSLDVNPVYQNLRLSLSTAEADLAAVHGQLQAQQGIVAELRSRVDAIPEVEAELARLNRDYEVNKHQHDTLLQRLESARISEQAEQNPESVKFRVIGPPTVPYTPSGPPRALLNTLVLLVALGAGFGLAVLLAQLHPTFATRDLLEKIAGVPVVGTISVAVRATRAPWYRRPPALVGVAVSLLFVVYGLNEMFTEPLRALLRNVLG